MNQDYDEKIVDPESYSSADITYLKNTVWDLYKQHIDKKNSSEYKLLTFFSQLNNLGQEKSLERIEELTKINEYTTKE